MVKDVTVAVVGVGVIGAAVAYALTREGKTVLSLTGPSLAWREPALETQGISPRNW